MHPGEVDPAEQARRDLVWQQIKSERYPASITRIRSLTDVVAALASASRQERQISIVSGGHSYVGNGVQDGTAVLDLRELASVDIDPIARTASVGPAARNGELDAALAEHDLAFPVGHSPSVGIGGYLLAGGLSWNPEGWGGGACFSVTGAQVVLASGEVVAVSSSSHPELFWALRGAGPYFPGVVTRFELALHPRPAAIRELSATYDIESLDALIAWATTQLDAKSPLVELSLAFVVSDTRPRIVVSAVAFASSELEARELLSPLEVALPGGTVEAPAVHVRTMATLLAANDEQPARYCVETVWTDDVERTLRQCARLILRAPSPQSLLWVGLRTARVATPDAPFAAPGRAIVFSSAIWSDEEADADGLAWSDRLVEALAPISTGSYLAEADYLRHPERVAACFTPAAWERLSAVRRAYDPHALFFSPEAG